MNNNPVLRGTGPGRGEGSEGKEELWMRKGEEEEEELVEDEV